MSENISPQARQGNADRVILLIDGESLFQAAACLEFEVDYAKLLAYLSCQCDLLRAFFYTGVSAGNQKQQSFLKWMQRNGYRVVSKELALQKDGRRSANLAVEIATDLLRLVHQVDRFILMTHNADLTYAIATASQQGVQFELIGLPDRMSDELISLCDRLTDIAALQTAICKT